MDKFKEVNTSMVFDNFHEVLDSVIPGGTIENLDKSVLSKRSLYLTRISMDGLEDMHEYSKDERLYRYFEFEPFKDINETKGYLQKLIDKIGNEVMDRKFMYWFIRTIDHNKVIGSIGLVDIDVYRGSAAWGYAIAPDYWGQGHILEAQLLVISYFFEALKMNRLWGITTIDNEPTISSVLAAGFQKEGILREHYRYANGEKKDGLIYSMLAKDYHANKKCLQNVKNVTLTLDKLKKICAFTFQIIETEVNEGANMSNVAEWDSLSHVTLILQIEKETGFKFKPSEIARATSIKMILEIVNGHTNETLKQ